MCWVVLDLHVLKCVEIRMLLQIRDLRHDSIIEKRPLIAVHFPPVRKIYSSFENNLRFIRATVCETYLVAGTYRKLSNL